MQQRWTEAEQTPPELRLQALGQEVGGEGEGLQEVGGEGEGEEGLQH